jgi:hypothetical protein
MPGFGTLHRQHTLERRHGSQRLPGLGLEDGQVIDPARHRAGVATPHLLVLQQAGAQRLDARAQLAHARGVPGQTKPQCKRQRTLTGPRRAQYPQGLAILFSGILG